MGKSKPMLSSSMKAIMNPITCIHNSDASSLLHEDDYEELEETTNTPMVNSSRLFFSPSMSKSIMEEARTRSAVSYRGSVVAVVASADPYADFRASMEEMVAAHAVRTWEEMVELLHCYLRLNQEKDHCAIAVAFLDLLIFVESAVNYLFMTTLPSSTIGEEEEEERWWRNAREVVVGEGGEHDSEGVDDEGDEVRWRMKDEGGGDGDG